MSAAPGSALRQALRVVGRGGFLSRDEAREAIGALLDGAEPEAIGGAFLAALAARGETADEIAGTVDVLRARALRVPISGELAGSAIDVCGTGGDGRGTFNVSTAAAFVVAGAGVPVAKHGGRAVSSTCGSADVLAALGVEIEMPAERAAEALERSGVTFLFAPAYHPGMKAVAPLRRELGIRTVFNLAGPLSNPAGVRRQLVGVDRTGRIEAVAIALRLLGAVRAFVLSNEAGGDELLPFGTTHAAEVSGDGVARHALTARDFGPPEARPEELAGGDAATNAGILVAILEGEAGPRRDTVVMNAAAALVVAGTATDWAEGARRASASIDGGAAREALRKLVAVSQGRSD